MEQQPSFPSPHFRPDDAGELLGGGQFAFQFSGQSRLHGVGGDADWIRFGAEGILDFHVVLLRAKDDADKGLVAGAARFVVEKVQIEKNS